MTHSVVLSAEELAYLARLVELHLEEARNFPEPNCDYNLTMQELLLEKLNRN